MFDKPFLDLLIKLIKNFAFMKMVNSWAHNIASLGVFSLSVKASIKLIDVSEILVSNTSKQGSFLIIDDD